MGTRSVGLLVLAGAIALACGVAGAFPCDSDADCVDGARLGTCEAVGFCSFPADDCDSGQRFGSHAAPELAGTCVDPGGADSVDTTDTSQGGSSGAGSTSGSTSGSTTVGVDAGETSSGGTGGTTGASAASTADESTSAATGSDGSTTGGPIEVCMLDAFDLALDTSWCSFADPGTAIGVSAGILACEVFSAGFLPAGSYAGITTCDPADITGIVATIELVAAPAPEPQLVMLMEVNDDASGIGMAFEEGEVFAYAYVDGSYTTYATVSYDAVQHRWWRLEDVGDAVRLSTSSDAMTWNELDQLDDTVPVLPNARLSITCGAEVAPGADTAASVDNAEVCLPR